MNIDENDVALIILFCVAVAIGLTAGAFKDEILKLWEWIK